MIFNDTQESIGLKETVLFKINLFIISNILLFTNYYISLDMAYLQ